MTNSVINVILKSYYETFDFELEDYDSIMFVVLSSELRIDISSVLPKFVKVEKIDSSGKAYFMPRKNINKYHMHVAINN